MVEEIPVRTSAGPEMPNILNSFLKHVMKQKQPTPYAPAVSHSQPAQQPVQQPLHATQHSRPQQPPPPPPQQPQPQPQPQSQPQSQTQLQQQSQQKSAVNANTPNSASSPDKIDPDLVVPLNGIYSYKSQGYTTNVLKRHWC